MKLDIGCGSKKREGFIGIDIVAGADVDYVINLEHEKLPFDNDTVDYIYSSHFLEHVKYPDNVLPELGRVAKDNATIELWTPYAFSNEAFLYRHEVFLTELVWENFCVTSGDLFYHMLGKKRWLFNEIVYVLQPAVENEILEAGLTIPFAIKYLKGIVIEFGCFFTVKKDMTEPLIVPRKTFSHTRYGERYDLSK
ncbi:MAG: class I SAM-dependent methyltransferase [Nitrospirae bacterium YQR-1]